MAKKLGGAKKAVGAKKHGRAKKRSAPAEVHDRTKTPRVVPSLDDLGLFLEVCELVHAGGIIHQRQLPRKVNPPRPLSSILNAINAVAERCRDATLINWTARGQAVVTTEGKTAWERAKEVLRVYSVFRKNKTIDRPRQVIMGTNNAIVRLCLATAFRKYNAGQEAEWPKIRIEEYDTPAMMDALDQGRIDFGIADDFFRHSYQRFERHELKHIAGELRLVTRRGYSLRTDHRPVKLSDLGHEVVCLSKNDEDLLIGLGLPDSPSGRLIVVRHYSSVPEILREGGATVGFAIALVGADGQHELEGLESWPFAPQPEEPVRRLAAFTRKGPNALSSPAKRLLEALAGTRGGAT